MHLRTKLRWVLLATAGLVFAYFASYLILLHPWSVAGGGTAQRVASYVNPFTGRMVPYHLRVGYFYEPARRLDALLRPKYWCRVVTTEKTR